MEAMLGVFRKQHLPAKNLNLRASHELWIHVALSAGVYFRSIWIFTVNLFCRGKTGRMNRWIMIVPWMSKVVRIFMRYRAPRPPRISIYSDASSDAAKDPGEQISRENKFRVYKTLHLSHDSRNQISEDRTVNCLKLDRRGGNIRYFQ